MKGIMICETPLWGNEENVVYLQEVKETSYTLKQVGIDDNITCYLEGIATKEPVTKATCNAKDTYDFETGALIALMKKCGLEKSAKAYAEMFDDTAYGDALIERDALKRLYRKKADKYNELNLAYGNLKTAYSVVVENSGGLMNKTRELKAENETLKKDNEAFRKTCEKLKEENKCLNASICAKEVLNKKLLKDYNAAQSAYEIMVEKSADLMDKVKKLEEENEKLKLDCEKLCHGYVDTDNVPFGHWDGDILDVVFLPGRACCKQYKALVNLFRKLPQDKIEAAYKEVYNTELPVWKKEFLNQMYGIYKESREKAELPTTLDINGTTYRKEISLKDLSKIFCPEELKVPTKREKMWDDILKEGRTPVYVERKDIHDFLEECQIAGIKWQSGKMPLETTPFNMSEGNDGMYFLIMTSCTPNGFRHVMTWWVKVYDEDSKKVINYLPPMRWDLFKKGRLAVKVTPDNYKEFYEACEKVLGKKPWTVYTGDYTVSICKKDGLFQVFTVGHQKTIGKKIVNWEDVK